MSKIKIFSLLVCTGLLGMLMHHYIFTDASENGILRDSNGTFTTETMKDHEYYFDLYDIEFSLNPLIEIEYPFRASPDNSNSITDINHWIETLPFEEDKDRYGYVVYPKHGITTPLDRLNSSDQQKVNAGKNFNHYPYLERGALHYRGSDPRDGDGNMVIAAHSSFKKDDPGKYKTVFQTLPISQAGELIYVYLKELDGTYTLFTYEIEKSFRTQKTDTSVLAQSPGKNLTTYGCYDIGSNDERWINQATLVSTETGMIRSKKANNQTHNAAEEIEKNEEVNIAAESDILAKHISDNADSFLPAPVGSKNNIQTPSSIQEELPIDLILKISKVSDLILDRLEIEPEKYELVKSRVISKINEFASAQDSTGKRRKAIYSLIYHLVFSE